MWSYVFKGRDFTQEEIYQENLNYINNLSDEDNPDAEFITPFPLYLIGQLFSGIINAGGEESAKTCAAATVRALDMICDNLFDQISDSQIINTHPAVLSEQNRIKNDVMLAKNFPLSISEIVQTKDAYKLLRLVPVTV